MFSLIGLKYPGEMIFCFCDIKVANSKLGPFIFYIENPIVCHFVDNLSIFITVDRCDHHSILWMNLVCKVAIHCFFHSFKSICFAGYLGLVDYWDFFEINDFKYNLHHINIIGYMIFFG